MVDEYYKKHPENPFINVAKIIKEKHEEMKKKIKIQMIKQDESVKSSKLL